MNYQRKLMKFAISSFIKNQFLISRLCSHIQLKWTTYQNLTEFSLIDFEQHDENVIFSAGKPFYL